MGGKSPESEEEVGIDVGLKTFAYLSTGIYVAKPRLVGVGSRHSHLNVFIATRRMEIAQITSITTELSGNDAWLDIVA